MSPLYCFFFAFARESEIGRAGTRTAMDERHDRRRSSPDLRPFLARHRSPHLRPLPAHRLPSRAAPLPSCLGARTSSSPPAGLLPSLPRPEQPRFHLTLVPARGLRPPSAHRLRSRVALLPSRLDACTSSPPPSAPEYAGSSKPSHRIQQSRSPVAARNKVVVAHRCRRPHFTVIPWL